MHPDVLKTFKYLLFAESEEQALAKMKNADGGLTSFCLNIKIEKVLSVETNVWYLPEYVPEILKV
jgi:hypothetical protein